MNKNEFDFQNLKIGVIGCGHMGRAIALSLARHGFPKQNLLISYRGNPSTYAEIEKDGLLSCLSENQRIFGEAGMIFLTVKPQDMPLLGGALHSGALVVSCAAGLPIELLEKIFHAETCRMMLSGPETVLGGRGVAAVYPSKDIVLQLLSFIDLRIFEVSSENDLDIFTAGVCLPAALLKTGDKQKAHDAVVELGKEYPMFPKLYEWAERVLPTFSSDAQKEEYIKKMQTKGGITETIIRSLETG
ncbi:MAG: NAD(P)-binding domain-containing protein, partial [Bacillota bacterium]|nr:NAD(P)-binding domain-containing protein [Bacillota bacterium]